MHCFNSSDPAAVNATVMYDFNDDNENLWSRSSPDVPLPPCSSPSSTPLDSQCIVCLDQIVHAVCRGLADGVKVMMEAGGDRVKISESGEKLTAHLILMHVDSTEKSFTASSPL